MALFGRVDHLESSWSEGGGAGTICLRCPASEVGRDEPIACEGDLGRVTEKVRLGIVHETLGRAGGNVEPEDRARLVARDVQQAVGSEDPSDIESLRRTMPDLARAWRSEIRAILGADGATIVGLDERGRYQVLSDAAAPREA